MPPHGFDAGAAQEVFESSRDFTVGLEEEFALLDPRTLSMTNAFEGWRRQPSRTTCCAIRSRAS